MNARGDSQGLESASHPGRSTNTADGTDSNRHGGWFLQVMSGVMGCTLSLAVVGLALVGRL